MQKDDQLDLLTIDRRSMGSPPPMRAHDNQYVRNRVPDTIGVAITDNELEIEQGIPVPMAQRGYKGTRLPLYKMQVKDSVFVPLGYNGREDLDRLTNWVRGQLSNFRKNGEAREWAFVTKQIHNGVRFWRVK